MGCATSVVKYFVFLANLIFALAGLALIIIGILYKVKYSAATDALPTEFGLAPILSIIIGAVVFITAFMGCCGAVKESPCMLTTYAIILLTIFIIQVAIGVYAFLMIKDEREFRNAIHNGLDKPFSKYSQRQPEAVETVDLIQKLLHCCGLDDPNDIRFQNGSYPFSCCTYGVTSCGNTDRSFHNTPCSPAMIDFLQSSSKIIGGVAIGIAVIELACCGVNGPDDFDLHLYNNGTLPRSCCRDLHPAQECDKRKANSLIYHDSCSDRLYTVVMSSSTVVGGVVLGIGASELIGAFLGFCLASSVKNQYRRSLYA